MPSHTKYSFLSFRIRTTYDFQYPGSVSVQTPDIIQLKSVPYLCPPNLLPMVECQSKLHKNSRKQIKLKASSYPNTNRKKKIAEGIVELLHFDKCDHLSASEMIN